jgi:hypothetical protein
MSSVERFAPQQNAFNPEEMRLLGRAFDMACSLVGYSPQPTLIRVAIAKSIMEAAMKGERDPFSLRDAGLAAGEQRSSAAEA